AGGRYVIRFTSQPNPRVLGGTLEGGKPVPRSWIGCKLKELTGRLRARSVDLDVVFNTDRQSVPMRLVLSWNPVRKDHMRLGTNLWPEHFDLAAVRNLYHLRSQIELLFKEWK